MKPTVFGILGAGWRAEFYLRIAAALPHLFRVSGIYVRRPERAEELRKMGAPVIEDKEVFYASEMDFAVCCVRSADMLTEARELLDRGIPVLCETPAAISETRSGRICRFRWLPPASASAPSIFTRSLSR